MPGEARYMQSLQLSSSLLASTCVCFANSGGTGKSLREYHQKFLAGLFAIAAPTMGDLRLQIYK